MKHSLMILSLLGMTISLCGCPLGLPPSSEGIQGISSVRVETYSRTIVVSSVDELIATVSSTKAGDTEVVIKDGVYVLPSSLYLTGDHLCYRSESGRRLWSPT